jgi:preprotein translocase subunit SecE
MRVFGKIRIFLEEARQELRHVNWPTRQEAVRLTGIVIFLSLAIAVFLGFFDYLFGLGLRIFVLQ